MSDLANVFIKVFVREFYRLNAGFFIIVITLTFGFMSGAEHQALAEFFITAPLLTCIPITLWLLYALKIIAFNMQRLQLSENQFLFATSQLSYQQQVLVSLQSLALQFVPAILYGTFLILMSLRYGLVLPITLIATAIFLLISFSSLALIRSLQTPAREIKTSLLKKLFDRHTVRPIWWIYIVTVLRKEPFLFLGTKVFTGLLLFAVMRLYGNEDYDGRLLAMGAIVAGVSNFMVMMQLQQFDFRYFVLIKSLPLSFMKRWWYKASVTFIFVLPEIVMLIKYSPELPFIDWISTVFLIPALALSVYSILYVRFVKEDTYARTVFALTIVHIVLVLFKVPIAVFVVTNLSVSWVIFRAKYYNFEILPSAKE